ncbi:MAG TPA: TIGR02594 family protein, partial [Sphingomicrobium sp.]|nr:TIGR02594 family protein [Sphingomicrobium sp.]
SPLWALSWSKFGEAGGQPRLGDVLTFKREGGGHVGIYIGEDSACYHVLGGNQSDAVTITRIRKERLHAVRREYRIAMPASARPYVLAPVGAISSNEA